MSALGSKLGVNKGSVGGTVVGLAGGETCVAALGEEDMMCNVKEPV